MQALAGRGRRAEFTRVRPLIGMRSDTLLSAAAGIDAESQEERAIVDHRREIFPSEWVPRLRPTRGARELLEWLRDDRLSLFAASSANADKLLPLLRIAGAEKLIESSAALYDAVRSKPDPDIVNAAIDRSGCPASDVIMIGDTTYDVTAAQRAGIAIIALRSGGWSDGDLVGAAAIYDDPADLLERYDRSPFKRPAPARSA